MRHPYVVRLASVVALAAAVVPSAGCKNEQQEAAQASEREVRAHLRQAREGVERLTGDFAPLLAALSPELAAPVQSNSEDNVRFALLGLGTRQTPAGSLTMYSTGFVAAVRPDGTAIARDIAAPDDLMRGMPLGTLFPAVRDALAGTAGHALGALPASADQPERVYLVAAAPIRANGAIVGALAAGISYGRIALALERGIRVHSGTRPVLWVGLQHAGRVFPSGRDRDVAERWLVPQALVNAIPRDAAARLARGNGEFTWNFVEAGRLGWGAGMTTVAALPDTRVVVFRSEGLTH